MAKIQRGPVEEIVLVETYKDPLSGLYKVGRSLRIAPSFEAIWYQNIDLGFPDIRTSVRNNPSASGTYDETKYHGARAISLELTVVDDAFRDFYGVETWDQSIDWNSAAYWITLLGSWMSPEMRYRLFVRAKGQRGNARFVDVLPGGFSAPMSASNVRDVLMQFINPTGKIYDFDTSTAATEDGRTRNEIRQLEAPSDGVETPITMPLEFPDVARGTSGIMYLGSVANGFIARIYSDPLVATVDPRITVTWPDGTTRSIGFDGLTIPAAQFLEIDTIERTVTINGDPELRANQYLTAPLAWPEFKPGMNTFDFTVAAGGSVGALAFVEVLHYSAFLA